MEIANIPQIKYKHESVFILGLLFLLFTASITIHDG